MQGRVGEAWGLYRRMLHSDRIAFFWGAQSGLEGGGGERYCTAVEGLVLGKHAS